MYKKDNPMFHLLIGVTKAHHQQIHKLLHDLDIHRGQPPLLHLLYEEEGKNQKEISKILHLSAATVAKMVKRMERSGFITKKQDPNDHRMSRIYLTTKGKEIKKKLDKVENEIEEKIIAGFSTEEQILLKRFLIQIQDNLLDK
ncbi:MarR family transcriptional regulator [Orenia metallireducens]|uniref:Transcriptional regulator, MarR family n=1 Tax=Orenia metallireducens TaxID=1413210 RepID=A0A285IFI2_9FIRM|nr:MarR family transcriptional regulator [Orenia metallireducens]PRX18518.1 MarR family transcriptional regulator [Orenia metallireducens]SNY46547.1 transcriptional regulator, MarR family [Orenia metallireducens]